MKLRNDLWYARWFFWSCEVLDYFCSTRYGRTYNARTARYANGTNLCHFIRTIMWGTLAALFVVLFYVYLGFVVFVAPFLLFHYYNVAYTIGMVLAIVSLFAIFILIIALCAIATSHVTSFVNKLAKPTPADDEGRPGFFRLLATYIVAVKQRWCPTVNFIVDDAEDNTP